VLGSQGTFAEASTKMTMRELKAQASAQAIEAPGDEPKTAGGAEDVASAVADDESKSRFEDVQDGPARNWAGFDEAMRNGLTAGVTDTMVGCDVCAKVLPPGSPIRSCQVHTVSSATAG
jgi:hypothetical protein